MTPQSSRAASTPPDPSDVSALEKSLNESAVRSSAIWITFILYGLYLAIAASTITQRQLFLGTPLKLPVLNVELPLAGFFFLAPILFLFLHVYVLIQLLLLTATASVYEGALRKNYASPESRSKIRARLANTLFAHVAVNSHREDSDLLSSLLRLIAIATLAAAPVALLLVIQLTFLAYHSTTITWLHRALVISDILIVWYFWRQIFVTRSISPSLRVRRAAGILCIALLFVMSLSFLTFPGEFHSGLSRIADASARLSQDEDPDICRSRSLLSPILPEYFDRLSLADERFVDEDALNRTLPSDAKRARLKELASEA